MTALRRRWLVTTASAAVSLLAIASCSSTGGVGPSEGTDPTGGAGASSLPLGADLKMPDHAVSLNVVDVGGDLTISQPMIEAYQKEHPNYLKNVNFSTGDTSELFGKLKAQEDAGNLQIDMILGGNLAVGPESKAGLLLKLLPDYEHQLGGVVKTFTEGAQKFQDITNGYALTTDFGNYGPMIEYIPDRVPNPPKNLDELLEWAKNNPGKLMYGQPSNSTPGAQFVNALPYMLGEKDPTNPESWEKVWDYLAELGKYIDYYPSGTGQTMKELGDGSRDIVLSGAGWYINPRVVGTVPKDAKALALENTTYILDGNYAFVPKGVAADKLAVILDLMVWMHDPKQQVHAFDEGYLYPGPAVEGVKLSDAPEASQKALNEYVPEGFDQLLEDHPVIAPFDFETLGKMNQLWDQKIGSGKTR